MRSDPRQTRGGPLAARAAVCATQGHPLLSIKPDEYWGVDAREGGENRLAELWMELRDEVCGAFSVGAEAGAPAGRV